MWARGTKQWRRTRVMIVSADRERRNELLVRWSAADVVVAWTPLDVLRCLEREAPVIATVVLSDVVGSATTTELAEFLEDAYPYLRVFSEEPRCATTGATTAEPEHQVVGELS